MGVTGYSRAYLHHLHATHELLAQALLEAHNAWRYGQFLRCLQDAVRAGESGLDEFKAAFVSQHDLD
jgi:queuine tRNA-ribosyltransferase